MSEINAIRDKSISELLSLIGEPIYAIRNFHKNGNTRCFYISDLIIQNIIFSGDGIWIDTGHEIFYESELGNRFNLSKEEMALTLEQVKAQPLNNISQIFQTNIIDRDIMLRRKF